jgi:hypothetical protein
MKMIDLVLCSAGLATVACATAPATAATIAPHRAPAAQLDVNGDGFADVVASEIGRVEPAAPPTHANVLVYLGGKHGADDVVDAVLGGPGGAPLTWPGIVEGIGDVNRDAASDLLVLERDDARGATLGYVYLGGPKGPSTAPDIGIATPHQDLDHTSFFAAGDVNGDGFSDVGAFVDCPPVNYPVTRPDPRVCTNGLAALYIYLGSAKGLEATPSIAFERSFLGHKLAMGLGDFNGDGFDDVLWGTDVYLGAATGLSATPALTLLGPKGAALLPARLAPAGDLDHDGFADLIAMGETLDDLTIRELVYRGGATPAATPAHVSARPWFAESGIGDVTGDGIDDLLIRGDKVWLHAGGSVAASAAPAVGLLAAPATAGVSPGDVDGDGVRDLVLATPHGTIVIYRGSSHDPFGAGPAWVLTGPHSTRRFPVWIAGPGIR